MYELYDTWHNIVIDYFDTKLEAEKEIHEYCSYRASELAGNEVESDWKDYYKTYEEALEVTRLGIYDQFVSEMKVRKVS